MKKLIKYGAMILMLGVFLASCGSSESEQIPEVEAIEPGMEGAEGTASTSIDWAGTYMGVIPCADCNGIETTLVINADKSYLLSASYIGKGDGKPASVAGNWSWKTGNIIQLNGETFGPDQFFVSEGKVFQLDLDGNKITGDLADKYELIKQ